MLECLAPVQLQVDRFLPPTPIRMVINHNGKDVTDSHPARELSRKLEPARQELNRKVAQTLVPNMLEVASAAAQQLTQQLCTAAEAEMRAKLNGEEQRLRDLQRRNPNVRDIEIEHLADEARQLSGHILKARLRLDAIRVIWKG